MQPAYLSACLGEGMISMAHDVLDIQNHILVAWLASELLEC